MVAEAVTCLRFQKREKKTRKPCQHSRSPGWVFNPGPSALEC